MEIKMRGYGMIYALIVLLSVGFISQMSLHYLGGSEDSSTNFYGSFQNALYAKTLYEVAKKCLNRYDFNHCRKEEFMLEGYSGGYELFEEGVDSYRIEIWVLSQNPRNLHIIRNFLTKRIKRSLHATP